MKIPSVALLIINAEVLAGRLADCHVPYLAHRLDELGADLGQVRLVRPDFEVLVASIRDLSQAADLLLTAGGIGPGPEDRTMAALAQAFGMRLVRHTFLENLNAKNFEDHDVPAARNKMAEVPDEACILVRTEGDSPQVVVRNVYPLPGSPSRLHQAFEALADLFQGIPKTRRTLKVEAEEVRLVPHLNRFVRLHPEIRLGVHHDSSEPGRLELVLESRDQVAVQKASEYLMAQLPSVFAALPS
ncbi:MAG: molybdopterin-binding protein [Candidatus Xenobium sp.]|jgi:molybdopterin-biosynthesis enzyme MoeA-like protein|nr:competence/damage-inducible protein A [Burkholderiales bacterium]